MSTKWSEVQEVIDILTILKNNDMDLQYIIENPDLKLKDIKGIESLISENKWEEELNIGRATEKILESAKHIIATKSRGDGYRVTEEQINNLINLGLLTENDLQIKESPRLLRRLEKKEQSRARRERKRIKKEARRKKTAADELIEILDILETYIPGISARLPRTTTKLGDIEEIRDIVELVELPKEKKINIGGIASKAKAKVIGLHVDMVISTSNIDALMRYRLLTDEDIELYRKRENSKVNGKAKTSNQVLIEVLQILVNHGVDILDLPKISRKIGEIDYLRDIADKENLDKDYDIGKNLGTAIISIKEKLSGKSPHHAISEDEIKKMRAWGFVSDWELEKYQKQITAVQEAIIMGGRLKRRGINLQALLPYDVEIRKIKDIEGLEQIIKEEHIPERYKIGVAMRSVLTTAKTVILETENPEFRKIRKFELLRINDDEIDELKSLGLITETSMETFRKRQSQKLNKFLSESALTQYESEDSGEKIDKIMRASVAQCVADNPKTRTELAKLVISRDGKNIE